MVEERQIKRLFRIQVEDRFEQFQFGPFDAWTTHATGAIDDESDFRRLRARAKELDLQRIARASGERGKVIG